MGDSLERLELLRRRLDRLEPQVEKTRAEMRDVIREAAADGHSQAVIARMAGLSRERIRQIVKNG
jgi:DNA-directed RNA polymerase sigma subunit (sigma70/sigma32)